MYYQATFFFYGDTINVPVEADSKEQATAKAYAENPMLQRGKVRVRELAEGEQAVDDRATLEYAPDAPAEGHETG